MARAIIRRASRGRIRSIPNPFSGWNRWQSVAGKRYQVETTNALAAVWQPQGTPVLGTGGEVLAVVTNSTPPPEAFRLRVLVDNPGIVNSRPALADHDTDGDGVPDIDEFAAGADLFDPKQQPQFYPAGVQCA